MEENSTKRDKKKTRKNEHSSVSSMHDDRPATVSLSTSSSASSELSIPYHRHQKHGPKFCCEFKQRNPANYGSATSTNTAATIATGVTNNNIDGHSSILYCLHGKKNVEVRDHCHQQRTEGVDVKARKKLIIASVLCLVFMICEIIGGVASNSLAIATDAAHLLTDFASFMISLFAIWIAGRPSTQRMSFGWYRAEVIGALVSVLMIWVITAILVWLAIGRLINGDFELNAVIMLITSGLAILVNLIMGCQLHHGHTHGGSGGGHGHSHGIPIEKLQSPIALSKTYALPISDTPKSSRVVATAVATTEPCAVSNHACPASPSERIEDGAADLVAVDAKMPGTEQQRFSYQNSRSISEVNASDVAAAAVLAETAAGAQRHGNMAAKQAVNMNVRAAYIHVIGDMIQSVGVFIAALVIYIKPTWVIIDPICTFFFSIIVLCTTFSILKDALLVLMEGTPSFTNYTEVLAIFQQIEGVERVHNLRIWALSINKIALSVHLAIGPGANPKAILQEANRAVHLRYNFFETTIQIEDFTPQMESCQQCTVPGT